MNPGTPSLAAATRAALACPDGVLMDAAPPRPLDLAVRTGLGLAGAAAFFATAAAGLAASAPAEVQGVGGSLLRLAAVPPAAALLAFPPLVLVAALQGREPGLVRLAGVAAGGPALAGTWLGAGTPVLLLFLLTGEVDAAFGLLAVGMGLVAALAGAVGAVRNARRAGGAAPGAPTVLAHYALFGWTAAVLAVHLA